MDYRSAPLEPRDRIMLDYVLELTTSPHSIRAAHVERLREAGFDDASVLDICQVASYYNYVNRLADGLGVELEVFWAEEDLTMTRGEFEELVHKGSTP